MMASAVIGIMASLLACRDVIDILVLGFTINAAHLLPTLWAVFQWRGYSTASFYSAITGLLVVVGCKFFEPQLPDHPFADPLWPGPAAQHHPYHPASPPSRQHFFIGKTDMTRIAFERADDNDLINFAVG